MLLASVSVVAHAAPGAPPSRYASIVIEAETGVVLYERNADIPRYPASLTKIMTLYMAFEALAAKKLKLNEQLTMSKHAAGQDPSRLNLAPGSKLKVEDAIRAMTTKSANDAACAIGERLASGSEANFAEAMTAKGKALGLKQTTFHNASGLPGQGHISSARDLALLCKSLVRDFPEYYSYFSTSAFEFHGKRYPNQNRFLRTYYGADGIKTGFVNASGHNLAASAVRGGKRLVAIVLGGDTQAWTREHASRLLDVSYAKIDPSLVMVASNATRSPASPALTAPGIVAVVESAATARSATTVIAAAPAPHRAGAAPTTQPDAPSPTAIASAPVLRAPIGSELPRPNATANLSNFAATPAEKRRVQAERPKPEAAKAAPPSASAAAPATANTQAPVTEEQMAETLDAREKKRGAKSPTQAPPAQAERPAANAPDTSVASPPAVEPAKSVDQGATSEARPAETWSVQVGLFKDATIARRRGEEARSLMPLELRGADLVVARAQDGVHVVSRIGHLSESDARAACNQLQRGRIPCVVVPPGRPLIVATN